MRKIILSLTLLIAFAFTSYSQLGIKGGFALGFPVNDGFGEAMPGFDIGATYNFTDQVRAEFLIEGMYRNNVHVMPITVGADYSFLDGKVRPFAGFNLGLYNIGVKAFGSKISSTFFGLHPKAGVDIYISDNFLIDIAAKYHVMFDDGSTGQYFGLNFGIIYLLDL